MALIVLTGGARSGKSGVAARMAGARGREVVVAVAGVAENDPEMAERIARHRADRPAAWRTLEVAGAPAAEWLREVPGDATLVVDCLGTLLTGALWGDSAADLTEQEADAVAAGILEALIARAGDTIIVTNEVGMGVVPASASGRLFRDVLGRANTAIVAAADAAYLVVAGHCIDITAAPVDPAWPTDE